MGVLKKMPMGSAPASDMVIGSPIPRDNYKYQYSSSVTSGSATPDGSAFDRDHVGYVRDVDETPVEISKLNLDDDECEYDDGHTTPLDTPSSSDIDVDSSSSSSR